MKRDSPLHLNLCSHASHSRFIPYVIEGRGYDMISAHFTFYTCILVFILFHYTIYLDDFIPFYLDLTKSI